MEQKPLSAADVAAVTDKNHYGYGYGDSFGCGGGSWVWIILLFAIFGFGGNGYGFGRNGNGLTQLELQQGFDTQSVLRKLDGIENGLCDGFYATNTNMLQGQNQLQRDLCQGFASTNAAIAENRFAAQNCCCETKQLISEVGCTTNRNIDAVRYENAKNTCDIVRAIEKDGDSTRALINSVVTQNLRDKIVEKDQMLQTANFQLSQQAQSANLIATLAPRPIPAYPSISPWESALTVHNQLYGHSNYGCGCGCGNFA